MNHIFGITTDSGRHMPRLWHLKKLLEIKNWGAVSLTVGICVFRFGSCFKRSLGRCTAWALLLHRREENFSRTSLSVRQPKPQQKREKLVSTSPPAVFCQVVSSQVVHAYSVWMSFFVVKVLSSRYTTDIFETMTVYKRGYERVCEIVKDWLESVLYVLERGFVFVWSLCVTALLHDCLQSCRPLRFCP